MVSALVEKQSEIQALCERFGVARLEVFGSAASENEFDPSTSDVDFIIEFRSGEDLGPWLEKYFALREKLTDLIGFPVDLVMASAMKNPYFVSEANRTRRILYGA